ncbi:hypothetical protein D3C80_1323500 [compost metagenome]
MKQPAFQPFGTGDEAAPRHVLGKRGELGQRLLDPRQRLDDERAGPVLARKQPVLDQIVDRLAHRHTADIGIVCQIALGRQRIAMTELAGKNGLFKALAQFQVKRSRTCRLQAVERQDGGQCIAHAPTSASSA